jgi:hypothetical protein
VLCLLETVASSVIYPSARSPSRVTSRRPDPPARRLVMPVATAPSTPRPSTISKMDRDKIEDRKRPAGGGEDGAPPRKKLAVNGGHAKDDYENQPEEKWIEVRRQLNFLYSCLDFPPFLGRGLRVVDTSRNRERTWYSRSRLEFVQTRQSIPFGRCHSRVSIAFAHCFFLWRRCSESRSFSIARTPGWA